MAVVKLNDIDKNTLLLLSVAVVVFVRFNVYFVMGSLLVNTYTRRHQQKMELLVEVVKCREARRNNA
jgi:hypothetical protein